MSVYRFPKDLEQRQRWVASLPNTNFIYTDNKRICQLHFPKTAKTKMVKGHLIFDEPPSIFKDIPPLCISKVPHKRNVSAITSARNSLPDQLEEFQALDKLVVDCNAITQRIVKEFGNVLYHVSSCEEVIILSKKRYGLVYEYQIYITPQSAETAECKQALVYISGYITKSYCLELDDTKEEMKNFGQLIAELNRGRLVEPVDSLVYYSYYCYLAYVMYYKQDQFCRCRVMNAFHEIAHCSINQFVKRKVTFILANVFMNNWTGSQSAFDLHIYCHESKKKIMKLSSK